MYDGSKEVKIEASVTYRDGRKGTVATAIKVRTVEGEKK
jgi:long-chain acyl-CoA synthetase